MEREGEEERVERVESGEGESGKGNKKVMHHQDGEARGSRRTDTGPHS